MGTPEVIRRRRLELGLSVDELARALGVDARQIRRYEAGDAQPTLQGARTLARTLKITLDELAGGDPTYAGRWWSIWSGLPARLDQSGPVDLTHRGSRVNISPASDPDLPDVFAWRSELLASPDGLVGWYVIDHPGHRSRGTLSLHLIDDTLGGDWVHFALANMQTGSIALGRTLDAATTRLRQVVQSKATPG